MKNRVFVKNFKMTNGNTRVLATVRFINDEILEAKILEENDIIAQFSSGTSVWVRGAGQQSAAQGCLVGCLGILDKMYATTVWNYADCVPHTMKFPRKTSSLQNDKMLQESVKHSSRSTLGRKFESGPGTFLGLPFGQDGKRLRQGDPWPIRGRVSAGRSGRGCAWIGHTPSTSYMTLQKECRCALHHALVLEAYICKTRVWYKYSRYFAIVLQH